MRPAERERQHRSEAGRSRRFYRKGDLRLLVLDLLAEQPRHGYDIIRAMEDRSGGLRAPSPGAIYPTLELLADQGLVRGVEQDGRRVFAITDAGKALLERESGLMRDIHARLEDWWAPARRERLREVHRELKALHRLLAQEGGAIPVEALDRLEELVRDTRAQVERLLSEARA